MIISRFDAELYDGQMEIHCHNIVRILSFGIKNGVVLLWAITDPLGAYGLPTSKFCVKQTNDNLTDKDVMLYVATVHEKDGGDYFIFGEEQKIAQPQTAAPLAPPAGGIQL